MKAKLTTKKIPVLLLIALDNVWILCLFITGSMLDDELLPSHTWKPKHGRQRDLPATDVGMDDRVFPQTPEWVGQGLTIKKWVGLDKMRHNFTHILFEFSDEFKSVYLVLVRLSGYRVASGWKQLWAVVSGCD